MVRMVPLSDVATINPRMSKELRADSNREVSFLPMAAVKENGQLGEVETKILSEVVKGYTYYERGDIIFAKITPCFENGKATYLESLPFDVGFGSTEFHVLRPNNGVDGRYLFYMVWNPTFRFSAARAMTGAAGQKRVPTPFVKDFRIPLPPLPEQKRIAAILGKADAIRRKRQEAISLADTFLRSVFLKMFGDPVTNPMGWDEATIKDIATVQGGLSLSARRKQYPIEMPYLRVANVFRNHLDLEEIKTIRVTKKEYEKAILVAGDILVVEGHGNKNEIGRCAVWDGSIANCLHQNHLIRIRTLKRKATPEYVSYYINSQAGRMQMLRSGRTTSGLNTISISNVKGTRLLVPPINLQHNFSKVYHEFNANVFPSIELQKLNIETLFSSLQQRAFRGDL